MKLPAGDDQETRSACLDVSATYHDEKGEVIVAVVNCQPEQAVTAIVSFAGTESLEIFETIELNCPSWETVNGFAVADQVTHVDHKMRDTVRRGGMYSLLIRSRCLNIAI